MGMTSYKLKFCKCFLATQCRVFLCILDVFLTHIPQTFSEWQLYGSSLKKEVSSVLLVKMVTLFFFLPGAASQRNTDSLHMKIPSS